MMIIYRIFIIERQQSKSRDIVYIGPYEVTSSQKSHPTKNSLENLEKSAIYVNKGMFWPGNIIEVVLAVGLLKLNIEKFLYFLQKGMGQLLKHKK